MAEVNPVRNSTTGHLKKVCNNMTQNRQISNVVKVLILRAAGINCDLETQHAFELAGAKADSGGKGARHPGRQFRLLWPE